MDSKDVVQEAQPETQPQSVGALLKHARLQAGLTLEQVAEKINLRAHNIDNLEQDKIDPAVSMTFTRGYIKLYARLVGLDEVATIAIFDQNTQSTQKEPAKLQSFSKKVAKEASDQKLMAVTWVIAAVIIGLFIWWAIQQTGFGLPLLSTNESPKTEQPSRLNDASKQTQDQELAVSVNEAVREKNSRTESGYAASVVATTNGIEDTDDQVNATSVDDTALAMQPILESIDTNPAVDAQIEDIDVSDVQNDDQVDVAVRSQTGRIDFSQSDVLDSDDELQASTDEVTEVTQQVVNTFTDADLVEMVFEFKADCWINISDATGEDIAFGVKQEGRIMTLSGVPPIEVVLGAPSAVEITYDGEIIDMTQFPASRTARFELPIAN